MELVGFEDSGTDSTCGGAPMNFKRIIELAQDYVPPDPLEQVSISWPRDTWLSKRRAIVRQAETEERGNDNAIQRTTYR